MIDDETIHRLGRLVMEKVQAFYMIEKNRILFEAWYLEKYGKSYMWK